MPERDFNETDNQRVAYRLLSDVLDSTTDPLVDTGVYTGDAQDCEGFLKIVGSFHADQAGLVRIKFRNDGTNWDAVKEYDYTAGNNLPIDIPIAGNEVQLEIENNSGADMTVMRAYIRGLA